MKSRPSFRDLLGDQVVGINPLNIIATLIFSIIFNCLVSF